VNRDAAAFPRRIGLKRLMFAISLFALCFSLLGCPGERTEADKQNQDKLDHNEVLMKNQPTPQIAYSMDRYLLTERLVRLNDPNKMTYLYVILQDGTWLKVTIIGKLASTSKRLTSPDGHFYDGSSYYSGAAPDEMATWGSASLTR
jgi:hypothetical protein